MADLKTLEMNLTNCHLCPHLCGVNRFNHIGFCQVKTQLIPVSYVGLHLGEEPPISGLLGSGSVFFSYCNLHCVFCQNFQISQTPDTAQIRWLTADQLAREFLNLQAQNAHNINLISPTHLIDKIAKAIKIAKSLGLTIPIVYNSNGYDRIETLKQLTGLIDIYMPDIKYGTNSAALQYSGIQNYVQINQAAIREMFRQVGLLQLNEEGIAQKGLLVRHLVLPNALSNSQTCLTFLASLSTEITLSIMAQYSPQYKAKLIPELNRSLMQHEYDTVVELAESLELNNCFIQELDSADIYLPDFTKEQNAVFLT